jgi:hypothetical protein
MNELIDWIQTAIIIGLVICIHFQLKINRSQMNINRNLFKLLGIEPKDEEND